MDKEIIWYKKARDRFREIVEFLSNNWSSDSAEKFIEIVENKLILLKAFPSLGIRSFKKPEFRKLILTSHNMLIYRIKDEKIIILNIYDTRRNSETQTF